MSLSVWLPLISDTENQGLSELTMTSGTPVFKNTGKLSNKSLDLSSRIVFNCPDLANVTEFSISFWAKVNSDTNLSTNWVDIFNVYDQKEDGTNGNLRWETCYYSSSAARGISSHDNNAYAISSLAAITGTAPVTVKDTWEHRAFTVNKDGCSEYVNGELKATYAYNGGHITGRFHIGETNLINGEICDVRIWDNCISPQQIKRLSQGLVLHYRLSGVGGENLLAGTNNGISNWMWGMKVGDYTKTEETTLSGVKGCKFTRGSTEQSGWSMIYYSLVDESVFEPSTNYVLSVDIYPSIETFFIVGIKQTNAINNYTANSSAQKVVPNKWNHVVFNLTTVSSLPSSTNETIYFHNMDSSTGVSYIFRNLKLEKGSHPTPWCPNPSDSAYTLMGFSDNTEYDSSGFSNNGTKSTTGTITWDTDTARYASCYSLSNNAYINCGKPYEYLPDETKEYSINFWAYKDSWHESNGSICSCTESGGFSISETTGGLSFYTHIYGTSSVLQDSSGADILDSSGNQIMLTTGSSYHSYTYSAALSSGWHMITYTFNSEGSKVYIDGVLVKTTAGANIGIHYNKNCNLFIGAEANGAGGVTTPYFNGKVSDFRLFSTYLDADSVLALYNLGGSLDSSGTFHTYEYVEA